MRSRRAAIIKGHLALVAELRWHVQRRGGTTVCQPAPQNEWSPKVKPPKCPLAAGHTHLQASTCWFGRGRMFWLLPPRGWGFRHVAKWHGGHNGTNTAGFPSPAAAQGGDGDLGSRGHRAWAGWEKAYRAWLSSPAPYRADHSHGSKLPPRLAFLPDSSDWPIALAFQAESYCPDP